MTTKELKNRIEERIEMLSYADLELGSQKVCYYDGRVAKREISVTLNGQDIYRGQDEKKAKRFLNQFIGMGFTM